jgi:hypothetical protein
MQTDIHEALTNIDTLVTDNTLMFGSPVTIKKSPHSWPVRITGVKNIEDNLWVKREGEEWELFNGDAMILNSILQRLRSQNPTPNVHS